MDDLTKLTSEELEALLQRVMEERDRRRRLSDIPVQIAELAAAFVADGGDRATIVGAVSE